ncbi:uncharacterized protein EHS24_008275 [Apiotrichum porosum]|uniref:Uncharacterized protein n=1 Tax=Apiotrichum porosum TaxID=105984 RepID=A0A427XTK0_9TREE|nr:uncharacterized protein EHS24_008275 [Apiotrichum porosum]RSH82071.1 hypothetical protein EHS24_008275 [Apiotrichum porosum]
MASSSRQLVHPAVSPANPTTAPVPLASVASRGAPDATGLLFYSPPAAVHLDPQYLAESLAEILSAYPQLAGRLRLARPDDHGRPYTKRYHRTWMDYGHPDDPGMTLEFEERAMPMSAALPPPVAEHPGVVDASVLNDFTLAPDLQRGRDGDEMSLAGVKVTRFSCGGAALCVSASHILFDAGALGTFLTDWAAIHTAIARGETPLIPHRPYDFQACDVNAAGDLDTKDEDPALVKLESSLDVFRYDAWARDPTGLCNPPPSQAVGPPSEVDTLDAERGRRRGTLPPWHTLSDAPTRTYGLDFTSEDVQRIAARAKRETAEHISAQDAFAAHIWRLVARARGQTGDIVLDFSMACDARRRFTNPLPSTAPGCFNVCLGMQAHADEVVGPNGAGWAAARIRRAIETTKPDILAAWLHLRAHDLDPSRNCIVFPGTTSVCTTNWSRSALHDADFGGGPPLLVHNLVMAFGGYATITRVPGVTGGRWYDPGVRATLWLQVDAMDRLLADPDFRGARP